MKPSGLLSVALQPLVAQKFSSPLLPLAAQKSSLLSRWLPDIRTIRIIICKSYWEHSWIRQKLVDVFSICKILWSLEAREQSVWFEIWSFYIFLGSFDRAEKSVWLQATLNREIIFHVCLFPPDCPEVVAIQHSFSPRRRSHKKGVEYYPFCSLPPLCKYGIPHFLGGHSFPCCPEQISVFVRSQVSCRQSKNEVQPGFGLLIVFKNQNQII